MYKFNDFQYDTYAEELIDIVKASKEEYLSIIRDMLLDNGDYDEPSYSYQKSLMELGVGTFIGDATGIVYSIVTKTPFKNALTSMLLLTGTGLIGVGISTIVEVLQSFKNVKEKSNEIYEEIIKRLEEKIKNRKDLTVDQVHQITKSLKNEEFDYKFEIDEGFTKLEITLLTLKERKLSLLEGIKDYDLLRFYEVLIHIANIAYEGYEEDIIKAKDLIEEYLHAKKTNKDFDKWEYIDIFNEYERKCASIARTRKKTLK